MIAALGQLLKFLQLGRHAVFFQIAPATLDHFVNDGVDAFDGGLVGVLEGNDQGPRVLVLHVSLQKTHRRGNARSHGHDDLFRRDRFGQRHPVQWPRAAKRYQREFPWIDAARDRVGADGQRHIRIDDFDDAERGVGYRQTKRLCHLRLDGFVGEIGVERQIAAQHPVDVEAPKHDLRVGNGGLFAASAITGRARFGPRRAGPHMEATRGIDIGDRSATGADRDKIDHRHQDWMAVHVGVARIHDLDAAVGDGADVGRRTADIDGNQVGAPAQLPSARPPITPPAGPDIRMPTAFCEQFSTVAMPPFDWMTRKLARNPFSLSLFCRLLR